MKKIICALTACLMIFQMTAFASFPDVGSRHSWATEAIENFSNMKILLGREDGLFYPDDFVTRAEFAKILTVAFNLSGESEFSDVSKDHWAYDYIKCAGRFNYNYADNFMPDKNASRGEIVYAVSSVLSFEDDAAYADETFSDVIDEAIKGKAGAAAKAGIVLGYEDASFGADRDVTRAEAVVIAYRALQYKYDMDKTENETENTAKPEDKTENITEGTEDKTDENVNEPEKDESVAESDGASFKSPAELEPFSTLMFVVKKTATTRDGDDAYKIYYRLAENDALYYFTVKSDCPVNGKKNSLSALSCGDVMVYNTKIKGYISSLSVIASLSDGEWKIPAENADDIIKRISVPTERWALYSDGKEANGVYAGYIGTVKSTDKGIRVQMLSGDLDAKSDYTRFVTVEEGTPIVIYNYLSASSSAKYENGINGDIWSSDVSDFGEGDLSGVRYIIVHTVKGKVSEAIVISFQR